MKNVYLLDANVFIEAKNSYYAFDIAPGFWESLIQYSKEGIIRSIDWIEKEIKKEDLLSDWVDEHLMTMVYFYYDIKFRFLHLIRYCTTF